MTTPPQELHRDATGTYARELGGDWIVDVAFESDHLARLNHPTGMALLFKFEGSRVKVGGLLPNDGDYITRVKWITAARDRGPAAVAREITRRVLPTYVERFHELTERNAVRAASDERRREAGRELAGLLPDTQVREGPSHTVLHFPQGTLELTSEASGVFTLYINGSDVLRRVALALRDPSLAHVSPRQGTAFDVVQYDGGTLRPL